MINKQHSMQTLTIEIFNVLKIYPVKDEIDKTASNFALNETDRE